MKWSGNTTSYESYFRNFWTTKTGSADNYTKALQDGVIEGAAATAAAATYNAGAATSAVTTAAAQKAGTVELVLYENVAMGDGRHANNPWLQELPDPITKACWDNFVMVSPKFGREVLGIDLTKQKEADEYEVHTTKPNVSVKVGNKEVVLPALIIPGMNDDTIAIALGYGRASAGNDESATARKLAAPLTVSEKMLLVLPYIME